MPVLRTCRGRWHGWFQAEQHKPQTKSKPKGRFFWFVYAKGKPKEPSLWFVVWGWSLNQPHHITNAALSSEVGGIAKRIKTSRLRRKTNLQKSKFVLDKIKRRSNLAVHHDVGTCLWHVSMQSAMYQRIGNMPKACPYAMALSHFRFRRPNV